MSALGFSQAPQDSTAAGVPGPQFGKDWTGYYKCIDHHDITYAQAHK